MNDSSTYGYDLTPVNSIPGHEFTFEAGLLNNAIKQPVAGNCLENASSLGISYTDDISISTFIKSMSTFSEQAIFVIKSQDQNPAIDIEGTSDGIRFGRFCYGGPWQGPHYPYIFATSTWYQVGLTFDYSEKLLKGYINGQQVSSTVVSDCTGENYGSKINLMAVELNSFCYSQAPIYQDDTVIVKKILTAADMLAIYNDGLGAEVCVSPGCGFLPPPSSSIAMHFPADNQTSTAPNFPYWETDLHINTSTIAGSMIYARIYFDTATHTSQYSYFIDTAAFPLSSWTGDALVLISHYSLFPLAFNTTYFAYANILDNSTSTPYATSSMISFTTGGFADMVASTSLPQFPIGEASTTCSGYGWIGSELCQVGVFLFVPSAETLNQFTAIKNTVANKPPFGYFTMMKNALLGLSNSSTSVIINASTSAAFSPIFGKIRDAMTWILWLGFGIWLFHRARNFQF